MDKTNKGREQRSTDDGTAISLRPLCSDAYGQGKQRGRTALDRRHKPNRGDNPDLNRLLLLSSGIRANTWTRQTNGVNSARQMMEQLFQGGHFVVMHMYKTSKRGEQHSTNDGTAISLRPLCSYAYGQDKQRGWTALDRSWNSYFITATSQPAHPDGSQMGPT